ncbi:response regulator [Nodosilinea sp. E11]|nr:response regulator [Nodosilinea sp. E11]
MAKAVIVLEPSQTLAIDAWLSWGGDACLPSTQFSEMDLVYTIDWLLAQAIVHDRLSDPPLEPVFADREARRAIALAPGHPPYRILIVDDDWKRRVLLQTLLAPLGFELQVATSGQEAILAWASWQPHLILMEMAMAEMDGAETVRHLRTIEQRQLQPETPAELFVPAKIIALAERIEGGYRALLQAGFDDAVARPLRSDSLLQKIADYLAVEYIYAPGHV